MQPTFKSQERRVLTYRIARYVYGQKPCFGLPQLFDPNPKGSPPAAFTVCIMTSPGTNRSEALIMERPYWNSLIYGSFVPIRIDDSTIAGSHTKGSAGRATDPAKTHAEPDGMALDS
jgi:hypothetical protein